MRKNNTGQTVLSELQSYGEIGDGASMGCAWDDHGIFVESIDWPKKVLKWIDLETGKIQKGMPLSYIEFLNFAESLEEKVTPTSPPPE